MVPNVIFCCCVKGCEIENPEFAVLIITLGVFSVLSDFSSGFSVLVKILAGFSVSDRPQCPPLRIVLPFKDQVSADFVCKQLKDLSQKTHTAIQPVFVSNKIEQELKVQEKKPPIVNQQCVVYKFQCDLCDASYVGYTLRHLHQRVNEHKNLSSSIGKHYSDKHCIVPKDQDKQFFVLKKCRNKFDC